MTRAADPAPGAAGAAYDLLRAAVDRLLPADAHGVRRPTERHAGRAYWEIGRLLNEHISGRAAYGERAIARLAADLAILPRTLYRARKVHQRLEAGTPALERLTWSHCRLLVTVDDDARRAELTRRAVDEGWSVRRLQAALVERAAAPVQPVRPGAVRVVAAGAGEGEVALDLGFGVRRPLRCLEAAGKRTRRLLPELGPGDTVELSRDDKGRPALRRLWGHTDARLHAYAVIAIAAVGDGSVRAEFDLGLDVTWSGRCRLRPPAADVPRRRLATVLAAADRPLLAVSHRVGGAYELDLFGLPGATDLARVAAAGVYLNAAWAATG